MKFVFKPPIIFLQCMFTWRFEANTLTKRRWRRRWRICKTTI